MSRKSGKKINKLDNPESYNVGIYIRTARVLKDVDVIQYQKERVEEYCVQLGLHIKEVYIDAGIDEFAKDKPAYKKMIQDIIEKKINLIVTANLLRIARNKNELIEILNLQNELGFRTLLSDSREEIQINNVNTDGISEFIEENDIEF